MSVLMYYHDHNQTTAGGEVAGLPDLAAGRAPA